MNKKDIPDELIEKYQQGSLSEKERAILESWYLKELKDSKYFPSSERIDQADASMWHNISLQLNDQSKGQSRHSWRAIAAIITLFSLSIGITFYLWKAAPVKVMVSNTQQKDILPGANKATLTLDNGKTIVLNHVANGNIANEGGVEIYKTEEGKVVYTPRGKQTEHPDTYNTMTTPPGGQFQVTLPDGTMVWLNATSSIKYPSVFSKDERRVELTGEAYFEVAHHPSKPFIVTSAGQSVSVLGTHFNINAYPDEETIKTTLLEGSIKVSKAGLGSRLLKPGQQSLLNPGAFKVNEVDVNKAIAWKKGSFVFENEEIKTAMRQISRWYNVEVVYKGDLSDLDFSGTIPRSYSLKQLLRVLELTGNFKFKLEGRRLTVML
jgi:transmembrane sensor